MKIYLDRPLEETEFLLKIGVNPYNGTKKGYMTKLNQDGSIPVNFLKWYPDVSYEIYNETFRHDWSIEGARFGESQNWAILMHPEGFTLEIYMKDFLEIIKKYNVVKGHIEGEWKWNNKTLDRK